MIKLGFLIVSPAEHTNCSTIEPTRSNKQTEKNRVRDTWRDQDLREVDLEPAPIGSVPTCKTDMDAQSFGELSKLPESKEPIRARTPTVRHRAYLGTVLRPTTSRQKSRSPSRMPPETGDRQGGLREARAVLVFGCAYWRIADDSCSATTLRRRRDEWIDFGVMDMLRRIALDVYERLIGLELSDVAIYGCTTKAPCGGERASRSPVDRGKQGMKRSTVVDAGGLPLGAIAARPTATTRRCWMRPWTL